MTTTVDIILKLIKANKTVKSLTVVVFPSSQLLQDRLLPSREISKALEHALSLRSEYNLPFWDALLNSQFYNDLYSPKILKEALFHNKLSSSIRLSGSQINDIKAFAFSDQLNYGINSEVIVSDGTIKHFILLDFHIPKHPSNIICVEEVLKLLDLKGFLMETNKSYHFIGNTIVDYSELESILFRALLFGPIIDKNWVAHQLIEKSCTLRITLKEEKAPQLLKVIS